MNHLAKKSSFCESGDCLSWIPFALPVGQKKTKMNGQRIIEALIIALITSGVSMFGMQQYMQGKFEGLHDKVDDLDKKVQRINNDIYVPRFEKFDTRSAVNGKR